MATRFKHWNADERRRIGQEIAANWRDDNTDKADWLRNLSRWLDAYQGRIVEKNEPHPGAASLQVPITGIGVDAIHARVMSTLFRPKPMVAFRPESPEREEIARRREAFLDWAVREEVNLFPVFDRAILGVILNGMQFVKCTWDLQVRSVRDRHEFPPDADLMDVMRAVLGEQGRAIEAVERVGDSKVAAKLGERKYEFDVEFLDRYIVVYTERQEIVRDAPRVTPLDPEDVVIPSDASYDTQQAHHIYHRYFLTEDDIRMELKRGTFELTDEELEELLLTEDDTTASTGTDDNTQDVKQQREEVAGVQILYRQGGPGQYEFIDAYERRDINDDGDAEEVLITICLAQPHLMTRARRLEEVYRHGMRPLTLLYYQPVGTSAWAIGLPQILDGLQVEFNVVHNQRLDAGAITGSPFGWYEPSAGMPKEPIPIEPGNLYPVDNVNSVKMYQPGNYSGASFQEEQGLLALFERRTRVSDLTLGRVGETQGAARTASGIQALSAQQAVGFDIIIRRIQEGWRQILRQILGLYAQYMPPQREVRIVGKPGEQSYTISRQDLTGDMDMEFVGTSLATDQEVERNTVVFLAQSVLNPANLGFLLQLGVTTPIGIAEWFRHIFRVFDVPRLEQIIHIPQAPHRYAVEEIVNRVLAGERVEPVSGENHQGVIDALSRLLESPEAVGLAAEQRFVAQEQIQRRQATMQMEAYRKQILEMVQQQQQAMQAMQAGMGGPGGPSGPPGGAPPGVQMPPGMGGAPPQAPAPAMNAPRGAF